MKIVAAYLLAVLGGNPNPSADDIRSILESGQTLFPLSFLLVVGAEAEDKRINHFLAEVKGKDITEVIAAGREKFASVPSGSSVAAIGVAAPGSGGAGGAPAVEEPKKEEKVEEKEESDEDMGFSLFD
ncbi:60S acidic ribosomal protein P2B-like isoform X1 [Zingiber officinale]|uniref:60S acidic ribosomal protein P2B-like isoform X1 n=1 Tax=Zingiber officinale TaxID=94328 RepID=UPI001C4B976C|nr:60S acidic ribosomal protein P2B-like isoform X1 [Zingiber officinale]